MILRALDLCASAGGLSLGLQRAGFDVLGVEFDADACATHRANVGPCVEASIVDYHPPPGPWALVAGGVPCQGYSVAGKRQGSDLWREWLRIGIEAQAETMLLENVEGILSWRYEDGWGVIARIEEALRAAGYEPGRAVLCAADYGVPQLRYRLILVAFRDPRALSAFRWPEPTHAKRPAPSLFGPALKPWVTVRQALGLGGGDFATGRKDNARGWNGERFLDVDAPSTCVVGSHGNADMLAPLDRPAPTITTCPDEGGDIKRPNRRPQVMLREALSRIDRPGPVIKENSGRAGRSARPSQRPSAELAVELEAAGIADRPATTVAADPRLPAAGHHDRQQSGSARLSLTDRATLQSFPPDFTFHGRTAASLDRQVGNAVPPLLAEAVGRSMVAALHTQTVSIDQSSKRSRR